MIQGEVFNHSFLLIDVKERKTRKPIRCQEEACKKAITTCPECQKPLKGTVEKGIDAAIITDLLSMAFDDNYDIGILISGDADFAPAAEYLQKKTDKQIVQAFFKKTWRSTEKRLLGLFFLDDLMPKLVGTGADKAPTTGPLPAKPRT